MRTIPAAIVTLFLSLAPIQDGRAQVIYDFDGVITHAQSGCSLCDPIPDGKELFSIAVGDTVTGTLSWDYDPATADLTYFPHVILRTGFNYSINLNGVTVYETHPGAYIQLREGVFYSEDENPNLQIDEGIYLGAQDAFRIIFNDASYAPLDGLPINLDLSAFDSVTFKLSALLDYSWDIEGTVTSYSVVPVPPAIWLFGSGLLGLVGTAQRKKA